ncbi:ATP-binding protein [Nocardia asiatica]|uniref:ATP-binding protein n=1 Tax=Nocardia asiatica TaxID=209252 RepID=UPI0024547467|nr:ATP-binding protein [Nocardia asiatica]
MSALSGFRFHQLLTVPAPTAHEHNSADRGHVALFAALTAAHAELLREGPEAGLAVAWERRPGARTLRVLVGGNPRFPPASVERGRVRVMYPPGSTATDVRGVVEQWAQMPTWVRCTGRADALWSADGTQKTPPRGGFEDYIAHLPGEFVWLVVARPLPETDIDAELADLEVRLPRLRARENSEPDRIALQRAESRYRELSRARSAGMWAVHVLVGGPDEISTARAAGLLCSASDLDTLPYLLIPQTAAASFAETWAASIPVTGEAQAHSSPFHAGGELLAALARPPRRELPGIRVYEPVAFDLTPERNGQIDLGAILDDADAEVGRFGVSLDTLNRHGFVAGATGSGKSQTVRHLLEGLYAAGVPWLVIEPAKAEYAGMAGRIDSPVVRIRPGDPDAVPVGLNPLEPEPGFTLQTHIDLVRALFLAAFDAAEPFPQVLAHALSTCYSNLGWDTVISEPRHPTITPKYPTLSDLQTAALAVVDGIGYGREITDNVRGFIDVRLGSLRLGTPGQFFEGGYRLDVADLLSRNVVLEIEDIGSDTDKAFFIGAILIRVFEHLRMHRNNDTVTGLRHVMVVEEAHRLLRRAEPGTPAAHAVELFTALLAEIRAYGEGILVAEQIPTKISPDVVKNTALKVVHRLPAAEDRDLVGATMNLDAPQSRHIVGLPAGRAVVFTDGMDRPLRIAVPLGQHRESRQPSPTLALSPTPAEAPLLLRDLHRAHHLADDPSLTVWTELMLLAHLVGRPPPQPEPAWIKTLTDTQPRPLVLAAIRHRLETAVADRYTGLAAYYQPEHLTEHLHTIASAALDNQPHPCTADETGWQAGRYRWADIERALHNPDLPRELPHPDTPAWRARGLTLPGANPREQLDVLHAHPDTWADPRIVTGHATPPVLSTAVARLSHATTAEARLKGATTHLRLSTRWPLALLDDKAATEQEGR